MMGKMESSPNSSGGLWKRQASSSLEEGRTNSSSPNNNDADVEASQGDNSSGVSLLSAPDGIVGAEDGETQNLTWFVYGHIGLSFLLLVAGSVIVPVFAAVEKEAWREENIPYQKISSGDVILDQQLNKPLADPPTISSGMLIMTAIVVPLLLVLFVNHFDVLASCRRIQLIKIQQLHELRAGVSALFVSIGLSEAITQTLKLYVRRHRPNFYALCGFDPVSLKCTAKLSRIHEASLSFPSGHSSLSFCGMTFLVYFFLGRVALLAPNTTMALPGGRSIKLYPYKALLGVMAQLLPWSYSVFVATSRIADNWHHPSDILAGTLLGITAATIGYRAFYPSPSTSSGGAKAGIPLSLQ
ncbi:Phospholipid phosphatase 5 [Seminavis robusta]|uniref:Phospholipid phosphatase 5 n=1 Tax=Seminavis robusta TaxID=568900 RepID=A0A9N8EWN6_9STRA|nr:Phospholipid phosphatase 5 [Seminavis robusta]|eukprot:Sro2155_g316870.1 Phospholipid phosphatase 5 (356) ;mRNA; f:8996-10162